MSAIHFMSIRNYHYGYSEEHQIGYLQITETVKNRVNQNFNFEVWGVGVKKKNHTKREPNNSLF